MKDDKPKSIRDLLKELNEATDQTSADLLGLIKQRGSEDYKQGYSRGYEMGIRELQRLLDSGQLVVSWSDRLQ
jgi:hypothetical protein